MIRQLTYLSIPCPTLMEGDAERLADASGRANLTTGLTGMMAFGGGLFFQVLEGPRDMVQAIFNRVRKDPRHRSVQILTDEMISSRDFGGFPMSFRTLDEEAIDTIAAAALVDETAIPQIVAAMSTPLASHAIPGRPRLKLVHVAA